MALTVAASGTQTCTVTTEHTLSTQTTANVYVLSVNLAASVASDVFEIKIKTKTLTGDTLALAYVAAYQHVQGTPIKLSPPVPGPFGVEVTLKQVAGTSRNIPWSLMTL